jgi:TPR repeat protein
MSDTDRGSVTHLNLICRSRPFPVRKPVLLSKLNLFLLNPALLGEGDYQVQSDVSIPVFAEFIKAVEDKNYTVTEQNVDALSLLCEEFSFGELAAQCRAFRAGWPETVESRVAFLEASLVAEQKMREELASALARLQHRFVCDMKHLCEAFDEFQKATMVFVHQEVARIPSSDLGQKVADVERKLEAEMLYRRGCNYIFGEAGFLSMKSQVLGLTQMHQASNMGHADAQFIYGQCLRDGIGCEKNPREFVHFTRLSAEQGNSYGEARYSYALFYGCGAPRNDDLAFDYAQRSSQRGNSVGQNQIAVAYENGRGVAKNPMVALQFYKLSADQGNSYGQMNYGMALVDGTVIPQDIPKGVDYFRLAAQQGNSYAQALYGQALVEGRGIVKDLNRGARWIKRSADQGSSEGEYQFGCCLESGKGIPKDLKMSMKYYRLAAEEGHTSAKTAYDRLRRRIAW